MNQISSNPTFPSSLYFPFSDEMINILVLPLKAFLYSFSLLYLASPCNAKSPNLNIPNSQHNLIIFSILACVIKTMQTETGKPTGHKQLDREIRDMVSSITNRVTDLHKSGSAHGHEEEDEHGMRIITLAGNNTGATMRSELDDHHEKRKHGLGHHQGVQNGEPEGLSTYVNSNFQAINNSLMMGGSYTTNDPGVHLDISDFVEPHGHNKPDKKGWKGKKKEKESYQSDHHHEHDDERA